MAGPEGGDQAIRWGSPNIHSGMDSSSGLGCEPAWCSPITSVEPLLFHSLRAYQAGLQLHDRGEGSGREDFLKRGSSIPHQHPLGSNSSEGLHFLGENEASASMESGKRESGDRC